MHPSTVSREFCGKFLHVRDLVPPERFEADTLILEACDSKTPGKRLSAKRISPSQKKIKSIVKDNMAFFKGIPTSIAFRHKLRVSYPCTRSV